MDHLKSPLHNDVPAETQELSWGQSYLKPLVLELDEAMTFCANSVVVGKTIIMPYCPPRVGRILCKWGYEICVSPVTEFVKSGGGVRCLTLALDVSYQNSG